MESCVLTEAPVSTRPLDGIHNRCEFIDDGASFMSISVRHNSAQQRFEAEVEGQLGVAEYRLSNGVMVMFHTYVPPQVEGRGIAAEIVRAALEYARGQGLRVDAQCSYVRAYMQRHPDTQDLRV